MAYPGEGQSIQAKPVTAASAVESFDQVIGRLEALADRAAQMADKIVGTRPSPDGESDKQVMPQHLIAQIQARRERLLRAVEHLENEMRRAEAGMA